MHRLRKRLGWLLLLVLLGTLAWLHWPGDSAIAAIEKAGGTVQRLTAPEYAGAPAVTLPDTVSDDDLEHMIALDRLRPVWLQLRGRQITGRGIASLKRLSWLRGLTLHGTSITDEDLVHLEAFSDLQTLNLDANSITDQGLEKLGKFRQLKSLSLRGNPLTGSGVERLKTARPDMTVYSQFEVDDD
jgi:hypothetical protein